MPRFKLNRTGAPPLTFQGERLAHCPGQYGDVQRYHDLDIYQTTRGLWVAHVVYVTKWDGEHGHAWTTEPTDDPSAMVAELQGYDPTAHVVGFPAHEKYAARQDALLRHVETSWDAQLTRAIEELGLVEELD